MPGWPRPNYTAAALDGLPVRRSGRGRAGGARAASTSSSGRSRCRTSSAGWCGGPGASSVRYAVHLVRAGSPRPEEDTEVWDDNGGRGLDPDAVTGPGSACRCSGCRRSGSGRRAAGSATAARWRPPTARCACTWASTASGEPFRDVDLERDGRRHVDRARCPTPRATCSSTAPSPRRDDWDNNHGADYRLWIGLDPVDAHVHVRAPGNGVDGPRQPAHRPGVGRDDPRPGLVAGQPPRRPAGRRRPLADQAGVGRPGRSRTSTRSGSGWPTGAVGAEAAPLVRRLPRRLAGPGPVPGGGGRGRRPGHRAQRARARRTPT